MSSPSSLQGMNISREGKAIRAAIAGCRCSAVGSGLLKYFVMSLESRDVRILLLSRNTSSVLRGDPRSLSVDSMRSWVRNYRNSALGKRWPIQAVYLDTCGTRSVCRGGGRHAGACLWTTHGVLYHRPSRSPNSVENNFVLLATLASISIVE